MMNKIIFRQISTQETSGDSILIVKTTLGTIISFEGYCEYNGKYYPGRFSISEGIKSSPLKLLRWWGNYNGRKQYWWNQDTHQFSSPISLP